MIRLSDMTLKNVINSADGRSLGQIRDFEIDAEGGRVQGIVLPADRGRVFRRREAMSVPWHEIKKIGCDVILVESTGQNLPDFMIDRPYPRF